MYVMPRLFNLMQDDGLLCLPVLCDRREFSILAAGKNGTCRQGLQVDPKVKFGGQVR